MKNKKQELLDAIKSLMVIAEDIIEDITPKKGDWITIESRPKSWSSILGGKSPLNNNFPITVRVDEARIVKPPATEYSNNKPYASVRAGGYGWCLDSAVWRYATKEEIEEAECPYKKGEFL